MSAPSDLRDLTALAGELRLQLTAATTAGATERAEQLRGELALIEDLALPEAVSELRLQRIAYGATAQTMTRTLPRSLLDFLG